MPESAIGAPLQLASSQLPLASGATGPTSCQPSVPLPPPVLPTTTESENASPGLTDAAEAVVATVGSSGGAGAVRPTLGPSAGSSAAPLEATLASAAALFHATTLTNCGGTLTRNDTTNDPPDG